jgi:hypothetical protein
VVGRAWLNRAAHIVVGRKQRERMPVLDEGFLYILLSLHLGYPYSGWVFPPKLILSGNTLTDFTNIVGIS